MRTAIVYDCLYPHTIGGAERWLSLLAQELARRHEVTYVTRHQWPLGDDDPLPSVRVAAVAPGGELYTAAGRRRIGPPLRFGLGVLSHFLRHRRDYDVVHCLSFPYFALIATRVALAGTGTAVVCEWLEYWTPAYWRDYIGRLGGLAGRLVQRLCLSLTPRALVFSRLNRERLRAAGFTRAIELLPGLYAGDQVPSAPAAHPPTALFIGRHIPDKRVGVLPDAVARARERVPGLRATILGDGPERARVRERVERLGLAGAVDVPGFVSAERLAAELPAAACLVAPSVREGHGMAVLEAAAAGVPVVVCRHPDNAAVELLEDGVNGVLARDASAEAVADAIVRAITAGDALRDSTRRWFAERADELSAMASARRVLAIHEQVADADER